MSEGVGYLLRAGTPLVTRTVQNVEFAEGRDRFSALDFHPERDVFPKPNKKAFSETAGREPSENTTFDVWHPYYRC